MLYLLMILLYPVAKTRRRRGGLLSSSFPSMGPQTIQFLYLSPIQVSGNSYRRYVTSRASRWWYLSGGRSCGSRWNWDKHVSPNRRSKFSGGYAMDDDEEEVGFGFRNTAKQRRWWSADFDDLNAEEEDDEGSRMFNGSIGFSFIFRVFRSFGWMIPAAIVSLLMGTGPNAMILSFALPIAQSSLSLIAETIWGLPDEIPRPKYRRKKRPFSRAPPRTWVRNQNGTGKSWADANTVSAKTQMSNTENYGGWDELDNEIRIDEEVWVAPDKRAAESTGLERSKISRRMKGDTPLFMRLLIAMCPYLGFWAKLF